MQERQAGIFDPIERGIITWDKIHELGEILDGSFAGRTSDEQVTLHANNTQQFEFNVAPAGWNPGAPNVYGLIWTPTSITWTLSG